MDNAAPQSDGGSGILVLGTKIGMSLQACILVRQMTRPPNSEFFSDSY